jgi:hypothetical protein
MKYEQHKYGCKCVDVLTYIPYDRLRRSNDACGCTPNDNVCNMISTGNLIQAFSISLACEYEIGGVKKPEGVQEHCLEQSATAQIGRTNQLVSEQGPCCRR